MEIFNKYLVSGASENKVVILNPPLGPIDATDALLLAAWLVAIAEHMSGRTFQGVFDEVIST